MRASARSRSRLGDRAFAVPTNVGKREDKRAPVQDRDREARKLDMTAKHYSAEDVSEIEAGFGGPPR